MSGVVRLSRGTLGATGLFIWAVFQDQGELRSVGLSNHNDPEFIQSKYTYIAHVKGDL